MRYALLDAVGTHYISLPESLSFEVNANEIQFQFLMMKAVDI
jgi:hypothetical protein